MIAERARRRLELYNKLKTEKPLPKYTPISKQTPTPALNASLTLLGPSVANFFKPMPPIERRSILHSIYFARFGLVCTKTTSSYYAVSRWFTKRLSIAGSILGACDGLNKVLPKTAARIQMKLPYADLNQYLAARAMQPVTGEDSALLNILMAKHPLEDRRAFVDDLRKLKDHWEARYELFVAPGNNEVRSGRCGFGGTP